VPAATGTQDVQDAVEQAAGVASRSANVRLCWGEIFLHNIPQIVVDFPECHDPVFYLRVLIFLGQPHNEILVRRGTFYLSLDFIAQWNDHLSQMNAGKRGRRFSIQNHSLSGWPASTSS
jgi:hypothetical protein